MNKFLIGAVLAAVPAIAAAATMTGAEYVKKAGASDLFEIQSSKLVLATTKNAKLKAFANEMVTDHNKSTADVKAAAMAGKVMAGPPMLDAMEASNVAKLKATTGTARDTMYIAQQKTSHQMALALQEGYSMNGSVAPLKAAAAKIVPVVKHHIAALSAM